MAMESAIFRQKSPQKFSDIDPSNQIIRHTLTVECLTTVVQTANDFFKTEIRLNSPQK